MKKRRYAIQRKWKSQCGYPRCWKWRLQARAMAKGRVLRSVPIRSFAAGVFGAHGCGGVQGSEGDPVVQQEEGDVKDLQGEQQSEHGWELSCSCVMRPS